MCCKALSNNTFIIGLRNGKLIKAAIHEFNNNNDIKNNKKQSGQKYDITFNQYIMGHMGSINVLEIDERLGIVITAGDDNKIFIRKLIDFELLTGIEAQDSSTFAKESTIQPAEAAILKLNDMSKDLIKEFKAVVKEENKNLKENEIISGKIKTVSYITIMVMIGVGVIEAFYVKKYLFARKVI
jgi:hypothetical protein